MHRQAGRQVETPASAAEKQFKDLQPLTPGSEHLTYFCAPLSDSM